MKIIYLKRPGWWLAAVLAVLLILSLVITLWWPPAAPATAAAEALVGKVVLIDPGHGGFDPGAVAEDGTHEDAVNLAISLKLAQEFRDRSATVIMTRMTENALGSTKREDMDRRLELIKGSGADVVISIHMNHFGVSRYRGAQIFYRTGGRREQAVGRADTGYYPYPGGPIKHPAVQVFGLLWGAQLRGGTCGAGGMRFFVQ